ncbi:MAG: ABC transporter substrate-binding protein [Anaerolineae bacterium]
MLLHTRALRSLSYAILLCLLAGVLLLACTPVAAPTPADTVPTPAEGVVEIETAPAATTNLVGEIVVSVVSNDVQTYQALADAYMALHPEVKVLVELKPDTGNEDSYLQWVRTQFAAGTPRASVIESPHFRDLIQQGRILNWAPYLSKINPYTGQKWGEGFEDWGLNLAMDPSTGEMYYLPYMSVQTFWVYNKSIFEEAGITDVPAQPTYAQVAEWCEKIAAAGYIPIAMEGTIEQIWGGGRMPWTMRSAMDQYHRDDINLVRCQPGDWCFREGVDDEWTYDPSDPHNDDPDKISINVVRHLQALRDGKIRFDTSAFAEMMNQVGRLYKTSNGYVPQGWTGTTDAYPLFLTQRAAMWQVRGGFVVSFPKDIARLAEGAYYKAPAEGDAVPTPSTDEKAAVLFDYGTFAFPTIEGEYVQAPARANELTSGYLAIPKKDRQQNDLEVDFVMFWTSPQGMRIFLENKLDPNNLQGGIEGPPIIKDVELPAEWQDVFANMAFIGNYEKPGAPGDQVARGFYFYEPTKREWAVLTQRFFNDEITAEEFGQAYQKLLEDNWDGLLDYLNLTPDDLDHPEKQPPNWVAGGPY